MKRFRYNLEEDHTLDPGHCLEHVPYQMSVILCSLMFWCPVYPTVIVMTAQSNAACNDKVEHAVEERLQTVWLRKYDLDYMEIGLTEAGIDLEPKAKCLVSQSKTFIFVFIYFSSWMLWEWNLDFDLKELSNHCVSTACSTHFCKSNSFCRF